MNIVSRAMYLLTKPNLSWPAIAADTGAPAAVVVGYVLPLAAIAPVATVLREVIIGTPVPFLGTIRMPVPEALGLGLLSYVLVIAAFFLIALFVNLLAPAFGATRGYGRAIKVTAYAFTPSFVAGVFGIIPYLGGLMALLFSLYSIYLLYLGLPIVMGTTKERAPLYTASVVGCGVVLGFVFMIVAVVGGIATHGAAMAMMPSTYGADGSNGAPDAGAVAASLGSAIGASAQSQQAIHDAVNAAASAVPSDAANPDPNHTEDPAQAVAAGANVLKALVGGNKTVAVVPREKLEASLPATIGDLTRDSVNSSADTVAGFATSKAIANYKNGSGTLEIDVADLGNASGLMAMTQTAANLVDSQDDSGYEKNVELNGQKVHETWKNATKHSEILGIYGSRFVVTVTADGLDMDQSEKAIQSVDVASLGS